MKGAAPKQRILFLCVGTPAVPKRPKPSAEWTVVAMWTLTALVCATGAACSPSPEKCLMARLPKRSRG
jgi:hypothetical protein